MELEGAKRSFTFLQRMGLSISTFISDRHRGIAKWIRQSQPHTTHLFDIWHVARSIGKKLHKASQEKGCELLKDWMRGVKNHLYWCVTSTMQGFENLILANYILLMEIFHAACRQQTQGSPRCLVHRVCTRRDQSKKMD